MAENNNKQENIILCGANSYQQKYYFNEKFKLLPENIKKELQIMCVLFTEDVGGILFLEFTPEGNLAWRRRTRIISSMRSAAALRSASTREKRKNF